MTVARTNSLQPTENCSSPYAEIGARKVHENRYIVKTPLSPQYEGGCTSCTTDISRISELLEAFRLGSRLFFVLDYGAFLIDSTAVTELKVATEADGDRSHEARCQR